MIKKGDERKECYKCKDCVMFANEDADSAPYCLAKDLYTFVMGEDEACEEFIKWNGKNNKRKQNGKREDSNRTLRRQDARKGARCRCGV